MSALRLICESGRSARGNVAMTAAMIALNAEARIPDTLRIYRYPKSVLLGRNQNAAAAADLEECSKRDIEIARRVTGGGAIYMDSGVVTWDLVVSSRVANGCFGRFSEKVCTAIAAGLSRFGCEARFQPENDIEIGGRKVAGASGYSDGESLVYQGSMMIAPDFDAMSAILRLPALQDSVTSLAIAAGREISDEEITLLLSESISAALDRTIHPGIVTVGEETHAKEMLTQELGREEFVFSGDAGRVAA